MNKKAIFCKFFGAGNCRFGAQCEFSHDPVVKSSNATMAAGAAPAVADTTPAAPTAAPILIALKPGVPVFAIDVECVATGTQHNARAVAQIAVVNQAKEVILSVFVQPTVPVVSYLTKLTGITKEILDSQGIPLAEALKRLKGVLPKECILVGQNIAKDVEWLSLREGEDFAALIDLAALLRVWNERYHSFTYFGLHHAAQCWLTADAAGTSQHSAIDDALKSMRLFEIYCKTQHSPQELAQLQRKLLETPVAPSFAKSFPTYDNCCMGNRKTCQCGAPFFS